MSRTGRLFATAVALAATMAIAAPAASAASGSISGEVTIFGTSTPIKGVIVCAIPESAGGGSCTATMANGTYTISALPEGEYFVEFLGRHLNYLTQYFPEKEKLNEATSIFVGPGESITGKDGHLKPGGKLEGEVTDATTLEPVGFFEVCAEAQAALIYECASTEPDGKYSIPGLPTDEYVLSFIPETGSVYVPQFYEEANERSGATAVALSAGEAKGSLNAALRTGASISGVVTEAKSGSALKEIEVCALGAVSHHRAGCAETVITGAYLINGLPSGSYVVGFSEEPAPELHDGFETQFWNLKPTLAEATVLALTAPEARTGVNARLLRPGEKAPEESHEMTPPPPAEEGRKPTPPLRCRKGFQKRKVRGKTRCVKKKKHRHKRRRHRR